MLPSCSPKLYGYSRRLVTWRGYHAPLIRRPCPNAHHRTPTVPHLFRCYTTIALPSQRAHGAQVRIPRLLFFGGDAVSVIALEAIYQRLYCIVHHALACRDGIVGTNGMQAADAASLLLPCSTPSDCLTSSSKRSSSNRGQACTTATTPSCFYPLTPPTTLECHKVVHASSRTRGHDFHRAVAHFLRDHLTVICPSLPEGMCAQQVARIFSRQYPVARFCAEHGLRVCPVDHPKSLSRSALLREMLSTSTRGGSSDEGVAHCDESVRARASTDEMKCDAAAAAAAAAHLTETTSSAFLSSSSSSASDAKKNQGWLGSGGHRLDDYDVAVVVSFRYFLPARLLAALPPTINMHPSLLPRYRGASPIFSTLVRNERRGGVSIIQVRPEQKVMDSGHILWQCEVPIHHDTDVRLYFPLITQIGAAGLCDCIFGETHDNSGASGEAATSAVAQKCRSNTAGLSGLTHVGHTQRVRCNEGDVCRNLSVNHDDDSLSTYADKQGSTRSSTWAAVRGWPDSSSWTASMVNSRLHSLSLVSSTHREKDNTHDARHETSVSSVSCQDVHTGVGNDTSCINLPSYDSTTAIADVAAEKGEHNAKVSDDTSQRVETETASACEADAPTRVWSTRLRRPQRLTAEAVEAAAATHRRCHLQSCCNSDELRQTVTMQTRCAELFPHSVLNRHCDWPDSFTYSWRFAMPQPYPHYRRLVDDPFHAPLLGRDAALLRLGTQNAMEVFGVWRAFVGGRYFHPAVHAVLDKNVCPVGAQLRERGRRRAARRRARSAVCTEDEEGRRRACEGVVRVDGHAGVCDAAASGSICSDTQVRAIAPLTNTEECRETEEGEYATEEAVRAELRLCCCFTRARHPQRMDAAVMAELQSLEVTSSSGVGAITPGTAYFPRADGELGAIKCREGWFFWTEIHVNKAVRAQPASLLRKGLAMKVGVLYRGLFGEYSHGYTNS